MEDRIRRDSSNEAGLTELEAPPPIRPGEEHRPSLEARELEVRRSLSMPSSQGRDEGLTELAAPLTINSSRDVSDEGDTIDDSHEKIQNDEEQQDPEKYEQKAPSQATTEIYAVSWLIFFSILGTLARLGVEAITLYPNSPFPSRVLWANLGGSFVMGFLAEDRQLFREEWGSANLEATPSTHGKIKKTIPLFIGLATGFCGSFTSFSSYMRDCFLALTNALSPPSPTEAFQVSSSIASRNGGFSFLALLAILFVHPAVSLAALQTGAHFALLLQPITPTIPFRLTRKVIDPLGVFLGFGCWLGAVFLAIFPPAADWRSRAVLPLVFAPLGCLLRFYASKRLNPIVPAFPLGTFAVNIFGTMVLGMAWDLQHASTIGASPNGDQRSCAILYGIMEGFCGCLTTVSTWVTELQGLRRRHAWTYGSTSVGVGLGFMIIIMGSMGWTIGFSPALCG